MYRHLRRGRYDVLHLHSTDWMGHNLAMLIARLARVPKILLSEHLPPDGPQPFLQRVAQRIRFRRATLVCYSWWRKLMQGKEPSSLQFAIMLK